LRTVVKETRSEISRSGVDSTTRAQCFSLSRNAADDLTSIDIERAETLGGAVRFDVDPEPRAALDPAAP
jgi:hypothetical protein